MPFISLLALLLPQNYLNRSVGSIHTHLVPDLRGKAFSFSPLDMILTVGFSTTGLYQERKLPSIMVQ
jgi:hypothetical protein